MESSLMIGEEIMNSTFLGEKVGQITSFRREHEKRNCYSEITALSFKFLTSLDRGGCGMVGRRQQKCESGC